MPLAELGGADWADGFHVWRMDWDAERIWLSVDGRLLNGIDVEQAVNAGRSAIGHPFRQPHYVLLNLAIGGMHGGKPVTDGFPRALRDRLRTRVRAV